jgi:hypothetical protein
MGNYIYMLRHLSQRKHFPQHLKAISPISPSHLIRSFLKNRKLQMIVQHRLGMVYLQPTTDLFTDWLCLQLCMRVCAQMAVSELSHMHFLSKLFANEFLAK